MPPAREVNATPFGEEGKRPATAAPSVVRPVSLKGSSGTVGPGVREDAPVGLKTFKEAFKETGLLPTHASQPSPTATSEPAIRGLYRPRLLARKGRI